MPGWIDTHVHLSWHFDSNHKLVNQSEPPQTSALYSAENAWLTLQGGFTTVQSVGAADRCGCSRPDRTRIAAGAAHSHVNPADYR